MARLRVVDNSRFVQAAEFRVKPNIMDGLLALLCNSLNSPCRGLEAHKLLDHVYEVCASCTVCCSSAYTLRAMHGAVTAPMASCIVCCSSAYTLRAMHGAVTATMAKAIGLPLERPLPSVYVSYNNASYNKPDIYAGQLHLLSPINHIAHKFKRHCSVWFFVSHNHVAYNKPDIHGGHLHLLSPR